MEIKYREIDEFPNYSISNTGVVIRSRPGVNTEVGKEIKLRTDSDGYKEVCLQKSGKQYFRRVHRLVAKAFVVNTNPEKFDQVNHKDGIKDNNFYENLEWTDLSGNRQHSYSIGLECQIGERNAFSKLTDNIVKQIRDEYALGGISQQALGKKYNTDQANINYVIHRKTWGHVQ